MVMERDDSGRSGVGSTEATSQTKTPVQARQGVISGRVITVLLISIVLVVAGFVVAYVVAR
jgi:hypothetical protein